ncbi:MAG: ATP-dependent Clp protease adapter protein ClpS [bacterium ADurb.Bin425]|nr:MAG: ATP-dependent Clp protease adapter protein ClpS [bacterium ADurb.Bin425]
MTVPANFSYRTFFVSRLVSGSDPGLVSGLDPGLVPGSDPGLVTGLVPGLVTGLDPGLVSRLVPGWLAGSSSARLASSEAAGTFRASVDGDSGDRDSGGSTKVLERPREKMKKPPMYKVLLHNDDYTTMEFVVYVLRAVFFKPPAEADQIMMNVHRQGVGIAGIYPFEVAEAKVEKVTRLARARQFPLRLTLEPE